MVVCICAPYDKSDVRSAGASRASVLFRLVVHKVEHKCKIVLVLMIYQCRSSDSQIPQREMLQKFEKIRLSGKNFENTAISLLSVLTSSPPVLALAWTFCLSGTTYCSVD